MEITNKVIVVTGGAGGIGLALGKSFLKENPKKIVLVDINFKEFHFKNQKIICKKCDVTNELSVQNLIDEINLDFGLIDRFVFSKDKTQIWKENMKKGNKIVKSEKNDHKKLIYLLS